MPRRKRIALLELGLHRLGKARLGLGEDDPVLRPLGAGERRRDFAEVELERVGEDRVGREAGAISPLRLGVGLDQGDARGLAAGAGEVGERLRVDGEEAAGRAIFGGHVAKSGAVGDRHRVEARTVELDELADDALLAQHLGDGQHEIGRSDALAQLPMQAEADHLGEQHRQRLAEHRRLRLDAADAPAEDGEAVDHGRVAIGADERVRIGDLDRFAVALLLRRPDGLREIFEVDLMADAGAGRHDREIGESLLAPLQEAVALLVLLVFARHVLRERSWRAEMVDDDRVIDDEIDRNERIDLVRIAAERGHRVAHRGEVDDGGDAGEVLHEDAGRAKGDLVLRLAAVLGPGRDPLDVFLRDGPSVLIAQQVLEHDLERKRQLGNAREPVLLGALERIDLVGLRSDRQRPAALETVEACHADAPKRGDEGSAAYK